MLITSYKNLFLTSKDPERSSYIWNAVTGILFAMQSAVMLIVVMRTNSIDDAGVFSIAYAVVGMMSFIGEFGVRKYQVSDINEQNSFADYLAYRMASCFTMLLACFGYAFYGLIFLGYSHQKFMVMIALTFVKLTEAFVDVIHGRFQQKMRLDVAAKTDSFRILFGMGCCTVSLIITHDLLISCVVWALSVVLAMFISSILVAPAFCTLRPRFSSVHFRRIFTACFPLFIGSFLLLYISNAPKYAIDALMNDASQAYYNFIFMPVFVVGLLANFIYNPILVTMAEKWNSKEYGTFEKLVKKQVYFIGGLTLLAVAVALTIGLPVLGLLYHADLSEYKAELCILMIGGGMLALVTFLAIVMTIIRQQHYLTAGYLITALLALIMSEKFVAGYGIMGASILYTLVMTILAVIFTVLLIICERKRKETLC